MTQPNEIDEAIDNIADSIHDEIKGDILYRDLKEAVERGYMLGFQQGCKDAIEKNVLAEKIDKIKSDLIIYTDKYKQDFCVTLFNEHIEKLKQELLATSEDKI